MTSRPPSIALTLVFVLALLPHPASAATATLALPTWPQKFAIRSGQTVRFGFPMDKPGNIVVDLQWTGDPLTVALTDANGKTLQAGAQHSPPKAHIVFTLTPNAALPPAYSIILTAPPAAAGTARPSPIVIKGTLSVSAPFDPASIKTKLQPLFIAHQTAVATFHARLASGPKPQPSSVRLAELNKPRLDAIATQTAALRAQLNTKIAAHTASLQTARAAITTGGSKLAGFHAGKLATKPTGGGISGTPTANPHIMSVSPGNGMPGDEVVLEVYGINTDTAGNHVTFTLASNVIVESMIYGAVVDGDNVRLTVAVPNGAAPANANATIAVKNTLGAKTNPAKFSYTPIPSPTITGVRATDGIASPGRSLLIDGANFATGSKVFFTKIPGSSGPVPAVQSYAVYPTSTVLPAGIPNYTLASQGVAGVYVVSHYSHKYLQGDMQGPEFPVVLDATTPGAVGAILNTATASTTSASPGFPMLVLGNGFTNVQGEVHCVLSATQDLSATILSWSDGAILVQCPDYQGIPAAVNGTVYVKGGNGSNSPPVPFTFAPQMEYQYIDLSKYKSDWAFYTYGAEDCWNMADNRCGAWHYDDSFWYGASGADAMFFKCNPGYRTDLGPQMLLKNNWTVCAVDWSQDEGNDSYQSVNFKAHMGSNNPYLEVDWSISAIIGGCTGYSFGIEIYGPKGCDYF